MITLTNQDGFVHITLPESQLDTALGIYATLAKGYGHSIMQPDGSLRAVAAAADEKPPTVYPKSVKYMTKRAAADVTKDLLLDKIEDKFGRRQHSYMSRFYNALADESGRDLHDFHVRRLKEQPAAKGHYPLRKIDAVIDALGADYVYQFARQFKFDSAS